MDEQQPLPPLEEYYTQVSRDALGNNERLGAVANATATAAEGFVSIAAPVRQQQEDTSVTEPVEDHRKSNVPTETEIAQGGPSMCKRDHTPQLVYVRKPLDREPYGRFMTLDAVG
ncbi:hypothetical protein CBS147353_11856 [Aspergillus niger]|nr:hypothetical protein CBS147353_11856 [Aspergillus niger]